ncbi:MAG: hypothetical protein RL497_1570 [Pseudomonadota bacterium]
MTLKGPGGTGKTATIKKIAVELSDRFYFPEGIDFVDCEFISDFSSFEKKIAASFNLENALDITKELREKGTKKDKLIIMDNVETLLHISDTQQIKDFVYFVCDYISVVITTREILDLDCEKVIELMRYSTDDAYALFIKHFRIEPKDATEKRILRQDIVEELLDNNPLAIKLVASNLPAGKRMKELKQELEEDIFRKASADQLDNFDSPSDINIERKKSLYASIAFSYKNLDKQEKNAFEILSLFPDGIFMEALKIIGGNHKLEPRKSNKLIVQPPISDHLIRRLENKSVIQVNNRIIKLQSIIGKFSERQLRKRKESELMIYYQRATDYHIEFANYLVRLTHTDRSSTAANLFNKQQANFFKSIGYLHAASVPTEQLMDYLDKLKLLTTCTTLSSNFAATLNKSVRLRALLENDEDALNCLELIILNAEYFAGDFEDSIATLLKKVPLSTLHNFIPQSPINKIIADSAINIYSMEGEALLELNYEIKNGFSTYSYSTALFQIGEFNIQLASTSSLAFHTLEAKNALGILHFSELKDYIAKIYEKDHIEIMQVNYLENKVKIANNQPIDGKHVQSLVIANPFTLGLQQLMLAFTSDAPEAIRLYEQALNNLTHIKYYYVEALLYYSRFLKLRKMHPEFKKIYQEGYDLACNYYYRWLRYQFEDLIVKKDHTYDPADYPLPEKLDIASHVQSLITKVKRRKK